MLMLNSLDDCQSPDGADPAQLYFLSRDVSEQEFQAALNQIHNEAWRLEDSPYGSFCPPLIDEMEEQPRGILARAVTRENNQEVMARELVMAGKIQADILPEEAPVLRGWDIAVRLEPARETSGDFYDFIPLTDHKMGVVVADVTDKGMGAALFMALSSTLIRTYAIRFPTLPALVLSAVSERILSDTRGTTFVTTFYGILEPHTGRIVFSNAGHPPGYLITTQRGKESIEYLRPTGMALGVSETAQWKQRVVKMKPGDFLVLYTDGITEAEDPQGAFFGEDHLLDVVLSMAGRTAAEIRDALLAEVRRFTGGATRQDDIALVVIRRKEE
jgi:serine phosphatase RsbU (regulator of sigma subunit)